MNDGKKKKQQKHQNKTAFKIQFDTLALQQQKKVSLTLLCKRCTQQINWKLQFNKYKKITQPSKCNYCHNKIVVRSYMKCCDPCAQKQEVCPKCLNKDANMPEEDQVKLSAKEQQQKDRQDLKAKQQYFDKLRQRSKRKVLRQQEKGIIQWDTQSRCFVDKEGNQITGLKFKTKGLDDLDKQMDNDQQMFSDEEINQDQSVSNKAGSQKQPASKKKNNHEEQQGSDQDWQDQQGSQYPDDEDQEQNKSESQAKQQIQQNKKSEKKKKDNEDDGDSQLLEKPKSSQIKKQ